MDTEGQTGPATATRAGLVARLRYALVSSQESPEQVARAVAVGAFFGFSPFLGLQILLAIGIAWLTRLNVPLVFLGVNLNLPWFLLPYYALVTMAARPWVGGDTCTRERLSDLLAHSPFSREFWETAISASVGCAKPFVLGSVVGATLAGLMVYAATRAIVRSARR